MCVCVCMNAYIHMPGLWESKSSHHVSSQDSQRVEELQHVMCINGATNCKVA